MAFLDICIRKYWLFLPGSDVHRFHFPSSLFPRHSALNLSSVSAFSISQVSLNGLLQPTILPWAATRGPGCSRSCIHNTPPLGEQNAARSGAQLVIPVPVQVCNWWLLCWPLAAEAMSQRSASGLSWKGPASREVLSLKTGRWPHSL